MADTRLYKVAITPCGKYVHGTEYDRLCLVLNATEDGGDGCSYVSLRKNRNVKPGTDDSIWALSLERGEQGERGPSGAGFSQVSISVDGTSGTPSGSALIANDTLYLSFSGMKGEQGTQGEDGAPGATGAQGPKGDTGATPYFSIGTVQTGAAGSSAAATITGTAEAPVLNLTIPQGLQGNSGYQGAAEELEVVNNLNDGGETAALSAEQGKIIKRSLLSERAKNALLSVLQKVAFIEPDVSSEMEELEIALFNLDEVVGVEATYDQARTIWDQGVSSLDELKADLTVKAVYGDDTKVVIHNYTLSGTLTAGTSTITVGFQEFTDTFDVTVTVYGSKASYVFSDFSNLAKSYGNDGPNAATYGWTINMDSTSRLISALDYGLDGIRNADGSLSGYYGVPVPKTASQVTVAITQNTLQVGCYIVYYDDVKCKLMSSGSQSFTEGLFTKTFTQDGTVQYYLIIISKPSTGNYPSGQPTALTVTFE